MVQRVEVVGFVTAKSVAVAEPASKTASDRFQLKKEFHIEMVGS